MVRKLVKWLVAGLGLLLMIGGAGAMWSGWGIIQVERGWSLFIGGAALASGGAVVFALAAVIGRLDALVNAQVAAAFQRELEAGADPGWASQPIFAPHTETAFSDSAAPPPAAEQADVSAPSEPEEIDRYQSGDTTYVMYSDGSIEVRRGDVSRRYESLARLREEAAQGY
jgi:hypothetical protein